jgi:hypothetical protein
MKRYHLRHGSETRNAQRSSAVMVEDPAGEWVRYSDIAARKPQDTDEPAPEIWVGLYKNTHEHGA